MAYLIPADKGTHTLLCVALTLSLLPLGWKIAAAVCMFAVVGREVYGRIRRGYPMTGDDWREAGRDMLAGLSGGAVVLAAAAVGL